MLMPFFVPSATVSVTQWSASDKASGVTISGGGLVATGPASYGGRADHAAPSDVYFEARFTALGSIPRIGVASSGWNVSSQELGDNTTGISYNPSNGQVRYNGGALATLATASTSDRIGIRWQASTHTFSVRINNGSWSDFTDFNPGASVYPAYEVSGSDSVTAYFDSASWSYAAPSGASAMP